MNVIWLFDAYSALQDSYQEHLLQEAETPSIAECFKQTLTAIQKSPEAENFVTVHDRHWFVKRAGGYEDNGNAVPEYLLVYTLDAPVMGTGIIRPLLVIRAAALGELATRSREVVRLIERTLARVAGHKFH